MSRNLMTFTGLVVAIVILIALNITSTSFLRAAQVDLTQDKLYTLSDGTKAVLSKLDEPVTLRLYFSEKLAGEEPKLEGLRGYYERVRELLQQYVARSGGKLTLELLDPEPFSELEDRAVAAGLEGLPLPGSSDNVYFGLSGTGSTDDEQAIPFFDPSKENTLEYDLTKLVYSLAHPKKLKVGICSSLPIDGAMPNPFMRPQDMPEPWMIVEFLRQQYEVKNVPTNSKQIDQDIDLLLVVHPKNLPDTAQYAIDQFVLRGGRAIVFVDPWCEADEPMNDPSNPMARYTESRSSNLDKLFATWGVELAKDKVVGDADKALRVTFPTSTGKTDTAPFLVWLGLDRDNVSPDEILTRDLKLMQMRSAGALSKKADATTEFTPLIESTANSMQIPVSSIQFQQDPKRLLADFVSGNKKQVLAARITGKVKTAFPGGAPKDPAANADEPPEELPAHLAESADSIHLLVIADADMLTDASWVQVSRLGNLKIPVPRADNGNFVLNAVDYMRGSTDMIGLRSRGGMLRPFKRVQELQKESDQRFRAEEQALQDKLTQAEQRWQELQSKKQGASSMFLSDEELAELDRVREEQLATRAQLRKVKLDLRKDVDALGKRMQFYNVWLLPILIVAFALAKWFAKTRKPAAA